MEDKEITYNVNIVFLSYIYVGDVTFSYLHPESDICYCNSRMATEKAIIQFSSDLTPSKCMVWYHGHGHFPPCMLVQFLLVACTFGLAQFYVTAKNGMGATVRLVFWPFTRQSRGMESPKN